MHRQLWLIITCIASHVMTAARLVMCHIASVSTYKSVHNKIRNKTRKLRKEEQHNVGVSLKVDHTVWNSLDHDNCDCRDGMIMMYAVRPNCVYA